MKFGYAIPQNWGLSDQGDVIDLGVVAEENRCSPEACRSWLGSQAALRRCARLGDGWHPIGGAVAALLEQIAVLRELWAEHGRNWASCGWWPVRAGPGGRRPSRSADADGGGDGAADRVGGGVRRDRNIGAGAIDQYRRRWSHPPGPGATCGVGAARRSGGRCREEQVGKGIDRTRMRARPLWTAALEPHPNESTGRGTAPVGRLSTMMEGASNTRSRKRSTARTTIPAPTMLIASAPPSGVSRMLAASDTAATRMHAPRNHG